MDRVDPVTALRTSLLTPAPSGEGLAERAAREGVIFAPQLLDPDHVRAIRLEILAFGREVGWVAARARPDEARAARGARVGSYHDPAWVRLQVRILSTQAFRRVAHAPAIVSLLREAHPEAVEVQASPANTVRVFSNDPEFTTRPHQDAHYVPRLGRFWTIWIPLGDCSRDLGPLAVLPGSHHDGLRPHSDEGGWDGPEGGGGDSTWRTADFRCGDALLFHCHTLHRALPNRSRTRLRLSADLRYTVRDAPNSTP